MKWLREHSYMTLDFWVGRYSRVPNITVGLNKSVGANFS